MTGKDGIISQEIKEILTESAQRVSRSQKVIADCALSVFNNYLDMRDKGLWEDITEADVWKAIAQYAQLSPWRVQTLAGVVRTIPREVWIKYGDQWSFGYFEAVSKRGSEEAALIFEFLQQYKDGDITYPLPGRVLGVGEFLLVYDTHICGKATENKPPEPNFQGFDLSHAPMRSWSWMGFLEPMQKTKRYLLGLLGEDKPNTQRLYTLLDEIEAITPEAMRELGVKVLAKK